MITTSDGEVAERARWLRNQGMAERYVHKIVGLNERMNEIAEFFHRLGFEPAPICSFFKNL